jgi:hypothetical protein
MKAFDSNKIVKEKLQREEDELNKEIENMSDSEIEAKKRTLALWEVAFAENNKNDPDPYKEDEYMNKLHTMTKWDIDEEIHAS